MRRGPPRCDLSGHRFGRLVAIRDAGRDAGHHRLWLCQCDCGQETTVSTNRLRTGNTKSCGCLYREAHTTHGATRGGRRTVEFTAWSHMLRRCNDHRHPQFKDYGGRGIRVCARWDDFAAFAADMGPRPSPKHSLDRIDVNGNYDPSNCRWATKDVQQHNRRPKSNTGHRGVSWHSRDKSYVWSVTRRGDARRGRSKTLSEAVAARDSAEQELYGDIA